MSACARIKLRLVNWLIGCGWLTGLAFLISQPGQLLCRPRPGRQLMSTKFLALAAVAGAIALSGATPALAVCNPGTPNCIRADSPWLAKAKAQVHQGDGNFNCDPGPDGFCSKSIPSG